MENFRRSDLLSNFSVKSLDIEKKRSNFLSKVFTKTLYLLSFEIFMTVKVKMNKEETVKVTVTVELPKKAKDLLEDFAKRVNTTIEEVFATSIRDVLSNFYGGDFYTAWTKEAVDLAKQIEKQFDC